MTTKTIATPKLYDTWFVLAAAGLIMIGLLMVYSASIVVSEQHYGDAFHFLSRQAAYLGVGFLFGLITLRIDIKTWENLGPVLFIACLFLLVLVLIPGIGRQINGSRRWLGFGPIGFQISELAKFSLIVYLSGYLVRRGDEIRREMKGFIKPMILIGTVGFLLLLEPDFGTTVVILTTALGMMYLAGVRLWQYAVLMLIVVAGMALLAVSAPYRMARLTAFLNPWANPFDSGYQLTQSLIAFGRGGWLGAGLGDSLQKLFYLPEAHTDFIFAVLAEELGLVGIAVVIFLYVLLITRALFIGQRAHKEGATFGAYLSYGFALWLGLQALINMGVNTGLLPTKGLTLPLVSYGGSSLTVNCVVIALLIRIDFETRLRQLGLSTKKRA